MKSFYLIPLLLLSACSTSPKLTLRPLPSSPVENASVRYPEVVRAYHFGRYVDPSDDLVMHEQHTVFRVEENTRWSLRTATMGGVGVSATTMVTPRDSAFSPLPVNDAVLAEVNAQKLATIQMMMQTRTLSAALGQFQTALAQTKTNLQETAVLRAAVSDMKHRLDALEAEPEQLWVSANTRNTGAPSLPATSDQFLMRCTSFARASLFAMVKLFPTPVPLMPRPRLKACRFSLKM